MVGLHFFGEKFYWRYPPLPSLNWAILLSKPMQLPYAPPIMPSARPDN